jgi:DNA-binding MarR family transcriptional regulator
MHQQHIAEIRAFNRIYTNIIGLLDQHILDSRYSLPEVRVMFELNRTPDLTASEIISFLAIDKGYLSRILRRLEKDKLIRKVTTTDKRASALQLTTKGQREFLRLNDASEQQVKEIFSHLTTGDLVSLTNCMREIQRLVNKKS